MLALTHESATAEERLPYLSWLFNPVPVLTLVGRSANMCFSKKNECVWHAWKDAPYWGRSSRQGQHDILCPWFRGSHRLISEFSGRSSGRWS